MAQPKPVYLKPGTDPTTVEREPSPPGCRRYLYGGLLLLGVAIGFMLANMVSIRAAVPPTATPTQTVTATRATSQIPASKTLSPTPSDTPTATMTPTGTQSPSATPSATQCVLVKHVLRGGTLYWIAIAFHSSPDAIAKASGISNTHYIYPGQALDIPCTPTP